MKLIIKNEANTREITNFDQIKKDLIKKGKKDSQINQQDIYDKIPDTPENMKL